MDQAQDRPEDFGVREFAGGGKTVKDCGLHEVATLVFRDLGIAPIEQDFGTLFFARADERLDSFFALARDDWAHLDAILETVAHLQFRCRLSDGIAKSLLRVPDRHGN